MLTETLNTLLANQTKATESFKKELNHLLQYCSTYPNITIRYIASQMIFHIDADSSYLSPPEARSKTAAYFYLYYKPEKNSSTSSENTNQKWTNTRSFKRYKKCSKLRSRIRNSRHFLMMPRKYSNA